jgi:hypothetical protein
VISLPVRLLSFVVLLVSPNVTVNVWFVSVWSSVTLLVLSVASVYAPVTVLPCRVCVVPSVATRVKSTVSVWFVSVSAVVTVRLLDCVKL